MPITPVTRLLNLRLGPVSSGRTSATFSVQTEPAAAAMAAIVSTTSIDGLLSLQEVDPPSERNRRARNHAGVLIKALDRLQRQLTSYEPASEHLGDLAALILQPPIAADPRLQAILSAIVLRAHVELARNEVKLHSR